MDNKNSYTYKKYRRIRKSILLVGILGMACFTKLNRKRPGIVIATPATSPADVNLAGFLLARRSLKSLGGNKKTPPRLTTSQGFETGVR